MSTPYARAEYRASYLVERWQPIEKTAQAIAGEQSCSTGLALPGEADEIKRCAQARVARNGTAWRSRSKAGRWATSNSSSVRAEAAQAFSPLARHALSTPLRARFDLE